MQKKLTVRTVEALKPAAKPYEARDTDIKGFLLRVQPSGVMTYYLDYRTPDGRRNRFRIGVHGTVTPVQARDVAAKKAADVAHGKDIQADKVKRQREAELNRRRTLGVFLDDVYAPWSAKHQSRTTDTVRRVKVAFADLLHRSMLDITPWVIDKWRMEQKKGGKAATTVNREMAALKGVLTKAVEWDYLPHHPLPRGKAKAEKTDDAGKIRYLSFDEEQRLRSALDERERKLRTERASANTWRKERGYELLPDLWAVAYVDYLKPMVLLALNTGMRRGELFKLTWENGNLHTRTITVEGATAKSRKTRHIPLNDEALDVLRRWKSQIAVPGLVFPSADGRPLNNVQTAWENLMKAAKIKRFRFHDLRHTFASKLVMAGVDLNTVRELLGHADIKMTLRYAHLSQEHKAEAVARLVSSKA